MLADALGVSYAGLRKWVRLGVICPSAYKVHSSGELVPQFNVTDIQAIKSNLNQYTSAD
jgi:hypothetical protein